MPLRILKGKNPSLKGILYSSLLLLILSTTALAVIPLVNLIRIQVATLSNQQSDKVLDHIEHQVDHSVGRIFRLSDQLVSMDRLHDFLLKESSENSSMRDEDDFLDKRLQDLALIYDDVVSIFAFDLPLENPNRYISNHKNVLFNEENPIAGQQWYIEALSAGGAIVINSPHLQNFIKRNYIWVVSFSRQINNRVNGEIEGILLIDINIDEIKDICIKNSTDTHYYFLLDSDGSIIFHPREELIYSGLLEEPVDAIIKEKKSAFQTVINNRNRIYSVRQEILSGWKIVAVTDVNRLYLPFKPPTRFLVLWLVPGLLFLFFISRLISSRILHPIHSLRESMKKVKEGQFDITVDVPEYDEIGALARDFNVMIRKIRDLLTLYNNEQQKLRISDFRALQSQINPHFLYNTLDSVIWMTAKNRKDEAIEMISSLSKMLRQGLSSNKSLVSLEEEYEHARQYCIIQKIRYMDQLEYSLELAENCQSTLVPRLILQPIIENALYHGIVDWDDGCEIRVKSRVKGKFLEIIVSDNGKGADIPNLQKHLEEESMDSARKSVGLKNINDRLKILFGENAGMSFRSGRYEGLDVILQIPLNSARLISSTVHQLN